MPAADFFSNDVTEADHTFLAACERAGVTPEFFENPLRGPAGEALNVGAATFGRPDAPKRLLVVSATHGVEGYAGAAIQSAWLAAAGADSLPAGTNVVLVHMLNPWGMAWDRRENENNVDLFRNLIYCDHPSEPDPLFDAVDDALDLQHWPDRANPQRRRRYLDLLAQHGQDRLTAAIRRGQHHRPKSLSYHGNGPTWSKVTLDRIVAQRLRGARQIAVIDIHTGFGPSGHGTVMSYDLQSSAKHARVAEWHGGDIYTPGSDADIPDHRARLPFEWIESAVPGAQVTAQILEFGTFAPEESRRPFSANHYFHLFGDPRSAEGRLWGTRYRHFSDPPDPQWREAVVLRGKGVIDASLEGLARWV
jgi:hypothetical protein